MSESIMVQDLKRQRLGKHLEEVQQLGEEWGAQLSSPNPFTREFDQKDPGRYKPSLEVDVDVFHMLKRHIKSRALWKHHTKWESDLNKIRESEQLLAKETEGLVTEMQRQSPKLEFTKWFGNTALEEGFLKISKLPSVRKYEPKSGGGLIFGGYDIEEIATGDSISLVEDNHKWLIRQLEKCSEWKDLLRYWRSVKRTEESMGKIVNDTLKSSDIFNHCRFCRKLFKAE